MKNGSYLSESLYKQLTAIIHKEDDVYVSLCPELDIASQGSDIEKAKGNLKEAVELFFECASVDEINQRYFGETYISSLGITL
jgi:predicted RNase H-like HicB family nuclease